MVSSSRVVLLTGATGLLGRYLLRELLLADYRVIVLVRNASEGGGTDRIRSILDHWNEELGVALPEPEVVIGDLCLPRFGLKNADYRWLAGACDLVLHSAASLEFRRTDENEPYRTNVEGTQRLVGFCEEAGIGEFHHVSTAFVCGANRTRPVREEDIDTTRAFQNPYEETKWSAERSVRKATGLHSTVYRPSIIVGDSRTGYTSTYHGIYRFAEMASRLAEQSQGNRRRLTMRLPMTGDELRNLVPVDWAASAIVRIVNRPSCHGRTYHLVSRKPVASRIIKEASDEVLGLHGMGWGGTEVLKNPSYLERQFLQRVRQYIPYLQSDPVFDTSNLRAALPDFQPPSIDRKMLVRFFEFAERNRWGQEDRREPPTPGVRSSACRTYMEETFLMLARRSPIGRALRLEVKVAFDLLGSDGGQWTLRWERGDLVDVERGLQTDADVIYRLDSAAFADITEGRQSPAQAFFDRRLHLEGDVEKGLNLAVWFEQLLLENQSNTHREQQGILHEVCR